MAKQAELLSVGAAQERIVAAFSCLEAEEVAVASAAGRILAADLVSSLDIPPFANSSMDGFALRSSDTSHASTAQPVTLEVAGHIAAGARATDVVPNGRVARIMTGAPLPQGADAVVPFEEVDDRGETIVVGSPVAAASCVRPAAQDVRRGQVVLERGVELHFPQIGLVSALGRATVSVSRRPRVAILSTGDELVPPGQLLEPGQIYNSNSPMLAAAVTEAGGEAVVVPSARDDPSAISEALLRASPADLLLTSGGASVGDHDHIRDVLSANGSVDFWRVRVRPGKPLLFGTTADKSVIGLPGNPTSAAVTFELFVRPAIRTMLGTAPFRPQITAVVDEPIAHAGGRKTYVRVRLSLVDGRFHADLAGAQDSAMLVPLAHADGLLIADEDRTEISPGEEAPVLVWRLPAAAAEL